MDYKKINAFIISRLENTHLSLSETASRLNMSLDQLTNALDKSVNFELYDEIAEILHLTLEDLFYTNEPRKFTSLYEKAMKDGLDGIKKLIKQGNDIKVLDSYNKYLIDYLFFTSKTDIFEFLAENNYLEIGDENYLKKTKILTIEKRNAFYKCLLFISKYNITKHYYMFKNFAIINKGLFNKIDEDEKNLLFYYINKNNNTDLLDTLLNDKYVTLKILKSESYLLTHELLIENAINLKHENICSYLGQKTLRFNYFFKLCNAKNYYEGAKTFLEGVNSNFISQASGYNKNIQIIANLYAEKGLLDLLKIMLEKSLYSDLTEVLNTSVKFRQEKTYNYIFGKYFDKLDYDKVLINACELDNLDVSMIVLKKATLNGKKLALNSVNENVELMCKLIEEGAIFTNTEKTFKQMSILLHYLITRRE